MAISTLRTSVRGDVEKYAWSGLARFRNTSYTTKYLIKTHQISNKHKASASKQALQIRHCLIQAEEYFSAARSVSLATKPLLLYYGMMSLALAEMLTKGSGNLSLDVARQTHKHHGLTLDVNGNPSKLDDLQGSASALRAKPMVVSGERSATFNLWWALSEESPVCGKLVHEYDGFTRTSNSVLLSASPHENRFNPIPSSGISLLDCLLLALYLSLELADLGLRSNLVRGRVSLNHEIATNEVTYTTFIHPADPDLLNKAYEEFLFAPNCSESLSVTDMTNGCSIKLQYTLPSDPDMRFPNSFQWHDDEIFFCVANHSLNEFGVYYVATYILGNYARYYPDFWMNDIERAGPLSQITHHLLENIQYRAPLPAYGEMERKYMLVER